MCWPLVTKKALDFQADSGLFPPVPTGIGSAPPVADKATAIPHLSAVASTEAAIPQATAILHLPAFASTGAAISSYCQTPPVHSRFRCGVSIKMNFLAVILLVVSLAGAKPLLSGYNGSKRGFNGTHILHLDTPLSVGDAYITPLDSNAALPKRVPTLESRMNGEVPEPTPEQEMQAGRIYSQDMDAYDEHDSALDAVAQYIRQCYPGVDQEAAKSVAFQWANAGMLMIGSPRGPASVPGSSQQRPGNVGSEGRPSTRPKGKGKAVVVLDDALIRRYETLGRTQYNAWLMAPDTATSGQLMTNVLGRSSDNDNWQRTNLLSNKGLSFQIPTTWSGLASDKTNDLARAGGLNHLGPAFFNLKVGKLPATNVPDWEKERYINSKLYSPKFEGPNVYFELDQDKDFRAKQKAPASGASYHTTFNVVDGVIIVHKNVPPSQAWIDNFPTKRTLPVLSWSDMTWVMWHRVRYVHKGAQHSDIFQWDPTTLKTNSIKVAAHPFSKIKPAMNFDLLTSDARGWLNWIVVTNIDDQDTISIMQQCLQSRGLNDIPLSGPNQHGKLFAVGEWCFYALMATESSKMIPELLAQHRNLAESFISGKTRREGLGHKMLAAVVLFSTQTAPGQPAKPALAWSVSEDQAKVQEWISLFEASWVCKVDEPGFHYAPSPEPEEIADTISPLLQGFEGSAMQE